MIVFAGPSIDQAIRDAHPQVDWRPPAEGGDFLALLDDPPAKVLLIDGLFDERAAIKHKEALALMAAGTRLYGAASMGALRAAELASFGMAPLGRIAHAYLRGLLVGDDEVALVHGDARIDFKAASVPMVDVRASLVSAWRAGLVAREDARALRSLWHEMYFVDRDWPAMVRLAESHVPQATARAIAAGAVDLKRRDAIEAIQYVLADEAPPIAAHGVPQTWFLDCLAAGSVEREARLDEFE